MPFLVVAAVVVAASVVVVVVVVVIVVIVVVDSVCAETTTHGGLGLYTFPINHTIDVLHIVVIISALGLLPKLEIY